MAKREVSEKLAPQAGEARPRITQAPDLVTFYANGARAVLSQYDVRIYFSEQVPPDPSDPTSGHTAIERVCVIMALDYAREFLSQLDKLGYELGPPEE